MWLNSPSLKLSDIHVVAVIDVRQVKINITSFDKTLLSMKTPKNSGILSACNVGRPLIFLQEYVYIEY